MQNWIEKLKQPKYDGRTKNAVQAYKYLIDNFDTTISNNERFQSVYAQFFRLDLYDKNKKRCQRWQQMYFKFLQDLKIKYHDKLPEISDFKTELVEFYNRIKTYNETTKNTDDILKPRIETSFVSKAFHMVNPELAIWDSNVKVSLLGLKKYYDPVKQNFDNAQKVYEKVNTAIKEKISQDQDIISVFKQNFPDESESISDVKILDFYYWKRN